MEKKHVYEIGFHILPTVAEEKLGDEVQKIRQAIDAGKGEIIAEGFPQLITLTYPMQKYIDTKKVSFDRAYFGWIKFESDGELAQSLKTVADAEGSILRHIIVKTVRENTVMAKPVEKEEDETTQREAPKKTKKKEEKEMSEEELDKSIDELVIE